MPRRPKASPRLPAPPPKPPPRGEGPVPPRPPPWIWRFVRPLWRRAEETPSDVHALLQKLAQQLEQGKL
jgi:hypothetical protein